MRTTRRAAALRTLWATLSGRRRPGGPSTASVLSAVPRLVVATLRGRYQGTTPGRLGLMLLAGLYVVSPVDLLPEAALLVVGLADDAVVLAWLAGALLTEAEAFLEWEAGGSPSTTAPTDPRVVPGQVV
ncbi:YkvA family protein [Thalassiella azotivora]